MVGTPSSRENNFYYSYSEYAEVVLGVVQVQGDNFNAKSLSEILLRVTFSRSLLGETPRVLVENSFKPVPQY